MSCGGPWVVGFECHAGRVTVVTKEGAERLTSAALSLERVGTGG